RLRTFAAGIKATGVTQRQVIEAIGWVFEAFQDALILKEVADEHRRLIQEDLAALRAEQQQAFAELVQEMQKAHGQMKADLGAHGFDPPEDLERWEELARIAEKEPGPMTIVEIYNWAIAWAKRESLRLKIAQGETPIQIGNKPTLRSAT